MYINRKPCALHNVTTLTDITCIRQRSAASAETATMACMEHEDVTYQAVIVSEDRLVSGVLQTSQLSSTCLPTESTHLERSLHHDENTTITPSTATITIATRSVLNTASYGANRKFPWSSTALSTASSGANRKLPSPLFLV